MQPKDVRLEPLRPDHADGMFAGLSDVAACAFLPQEPPADVGSLRAPYLCQVAGCPTDRSERWYNWVIRRRGDGEMLGYTQATVRSEVALVAYHVFPRHWRRGIGREALGATLDILFGMGQATLARALVDTRNEASRSLLPSLGFKAVREIKAADVFKGCVSDEVQFDLLRSEWLLRP